jgi:hypothetical protein
VRDSSSEALGAVYKALGEKIFLQNAGEIEQIKLDKVIFFHIESNKFTLRS